MPTSKPRIPSSKMKDQLELLKGRTKNLKF